MLARWAKGNKHQKQK